MKTIGILGGMGPRATVAFEHLLLERLPGPDQQLPTIVTINDGSIPDRSRYILDAGSDPVPRMQHNLQALEQLGAEVICVPCNTACTPVIFDRLQPRTAKLLNLPELVADYMAELDIRRVCILATKGTIVSGAYQDQCTRLGIKCVLPSEELQTLVTAVIGSIKNGSNIQANYLAGMVSQRLALLNCEAIILGCTELPLVADALVPPQCQAIDTLAILAETCVRYSKGEGEVSGSRYVYASRENH